MSAWLMIRSWRMRTALLGLAHWPGLVITPLAGIGLRDVFGWPTPGWAPLAAASITAVLVVAAFAGSQFHGQLDAFGIPCRWCPFELEEDQL